MHRILATIIPAPPGVIQIDAEESHHALSVKRLRVGETIELLDGRGLVAAASVLVAEPARGKREGQLRVEVRSVRRVDPSAPAVHVYAPAPKGDRLAWMIDQLSQVGAASWTPLRCERAVVEPGEGKMERLERIAVESMKQCGRAWCLEVRPPVTVGTLGTAEARDLLIIAEASGLAPVATPAVREPVIRLVVGPEGGFTPQELESLTQSGGVMACFGPHVMRIETAAIAAVVALRSTWKGAT